MQPEADTKALTPFEREVAALYLTAPASASIVDLAAHLHLEADDFLAILHRPHVAAWVRTIRAVEAARAEMAALIAHTDALGALAEVAADTTRDPATRCRAALAVLTRRLPTRCLDASMPRCLMPRCPSSRQLQRRATEVAPRQSGVSQAVRTPPAPDPSSATSVLPISDSDSAAPRTRRRTALL